MADLSGVAIVRRSLHLAVADQVRQMIVTGELPPGEKVPVQDLASALSISITPLREALKVLAEEQLVELLPNRGARVLPFTPEEAADLFEVMASLEALAAELSAVRMSDGQRVRLEEDHAVMRGHFERGEKPAYFAINTSIHDQVLKASGNVVLLAAHAKLSFRAARGRYAAIIDMSRWAEAMEEHERLMAALRARDGETAGAVWKIHLLHTGNAVRRAQISNHLCE